MPQDRSRPEPRYTGDDFYCDVALHDVSALHVVHDSCTVLAYHHTRPFWPVHVVVLPKQHVSSLLTLDDSLLAADLLHVVQQVSAEVAAQHGAAAVLTNLGRYQDSKHLHVHVSSGTPLR